MSSTTGTELRELGETFGDRLSAEKLSFALDYIDYNEQPLALDTLCDYLCEEDIPITPEEYSHICTLNTALGCPLSVNALAYLKNLSGRS
ncbi:MafI family immunity protein [Pseudomonas sp. X10]